MTLGLETITIIMLRPEAGVFLRLGEAREGQIKSRMKAIALDQEKQKEPLFQQRDSVSRWDLTFILSEQSFQHVLLAHSHTSH